MTDDLKNDDVTADDNEEGTEVKEEKTDDSSEEDWDPEKTDGDILDEELK